MPYQPLTDDIAPVESADRQREILEMDDDELVDLFDGLDCRQTRALLLTAHVRTAADIGRLVGVSTSTMWRWRRLDEWVEAERELKRVWVRDATAQASAHLVCAVDTLRQIMATGEDRDRIQACRALLDVLTRGEALDLESRVDDVETQLEDLQRRASDAGSMTADELERYVGEVLQASEALE